MGSALHIPLPEGLEAGSVISVTIKYSTTDGCMALQWLQKEYDFSLFIASFLDLYFRQTQGESFPYLFSQCQAIYARTLLPVQGHIVSCSI